MLGGPRARSGLRGGGDLGLAVGWAEGRAGQGKRQGQARPGRVGQGKGRAAILLGQELVLGCGKAKGGQLGGEFIA